MFADWPHAYGAFDSSYNNNDNSNCYLIISKNNHLHFIGFHPSERFSLTSMKCCGTLNTLYIRQHKGERTATGKETRIRYYI